MRRFVVMLLAGASLFAAPAEALELRLVERTEALDAGGGGGGGGSEPSFELRALSLGAGLATGLALGFATPYFADFVRHTVGLFITSHVSVLIGLGALTLAASAVQAEVLKSGGFRVNQAFALRVAAGVTGLAALVGLVLGNTSYGWFRAIATVSIAAGLLAPPVEAALFDVEEDLREWRPRERRDRRERYRPEPDVDDGDADPFGSRGPSLTLLSGAF